MKAVVVDDERHALREMERILKDIDGVEVIGTYQDGLEAFASLQREKPDIIFLDVEMPEMNGIELFEKIVDAYGFISIVFITAYNQYAIKAFELNAIDYILKPVEEERIAEAVKRARLHNKLMLEMKGGQKIRIECFKRLAIYANNELVETNWRSKKCEELLAFLLCQRGEYVSKAKIVDALWEDTDLQKGYNNLYSTVYYFKKKMIETGLELSIESKKDKMRLDLKNVEVDILEFEKLCKTPSKKEAAALYKGMLFEEHDYPWSISLQQKFDIMATDIL